MADGLDQVTIPAAPATAWERAPIEGRGIAAIARRQRGSGDEGRKGDAQALRHLVEGARSLDLGRDSGIGSFRVHHRPDRQIGQPRQVDQMKAVVVLQSRVCHDQIVGCFLEVCPRDLERAGGVDLGEASGHGPERRTQSRLGFHDQKARGSGVRAQDFM